MEKEKLSKLFIYSLFFISLVLVIIALSITFSKPLKTNIFNVSFTVARTGIGFDVNTTVLTFGVLNPGGSGKRYVTIKNDYDFPIKVKVYTSNNLAKLIDAESNFVVPVNQNKTVDVGLNIPLNFELGNYTGKIVFNIYKST